MDIPTMWVRYHPVVLRYLKGHARGTAEAEDLAQATFLKAMEHVDSIMEMSDEHVKAWLLRTAHNAFIDEIRKHKRVTPMEDMDQPVYEEDFSTIHVEELMSTLPSNLAEVVRLRHLEGYTSAQIGEKLDLPPATVRTRLRAAMILLQKAEAKTDET